DNNRILKGYEYIARYGLGEEVPYRHYLDRTGKYGFNGRNNHYTKISTVSRGNFWPIYERNYQHYVKRRGILAPYSKQVVEMKRPEGHSSDHVGLGTLSHFRPRISLKMPKHIPGVPSGLVARSTSNGISLTWVKSVDPVTAVDADSYEVYRANQLGGDSRKIANDVTVSKYHDTSVKRGELYFYTVKAKNRIGISLPSVALAANAALPNPWLSRDIGDVQVSGFSEFNGERFTLEGEGSGVKGKRDSFHFAYAPFTGEGTITARIVRPMSSQWTKPGVMMRETLEAGSRHASVLLLPHWRGALVARGEIGGETTFHGDRNLGEEHVVKKNRLSSPYWVRLIRFRNRFTGYISPDGFHWQELGSIEIPMSRTFYVGLPACSQLNKVTTTVTYDNVSIPVWRVTNGSRQITSRPEPRWHKDTWLKRHNAFNERVMQGNVGMLMIGDSITHWWDRDGKKVWDHYYANRNAVNLAISGDRTEHVLWRLENGNIDGISPNVAVLMIGTNNHMSSPPEITARDVRLIVKKLRTNLPETKILVLGIFPRGAGDDDGARQINMKVNRLIEDIGDGNWVHYLNIDHAFLKGRRLRSELIPDGSHPNENGYAAWAAAMEPVLAKLLDEEPVGPLK
ncbi:MAG: GDSL-type esterase/lipase family protein, partial [Verrucomicrobiota bacterium]|nr:GDSL-type esterase/lipase family protein [Verrucomicrobiota bacterium]